MNFRFNQDAFRNSVAHWQERNAGDNHTIIIGIVDRITRPVCGKIFPYVGKKIEKVTLRPFFTAGYNGFDKKPFSTVIRGDAPVWSVEEWAETRWVEDILRRTKSIIPDGMPYVVRQYLMSGGPDSSLATPKVLNWLSQFYAKMVMTPGDAAARESERLLGMAEAKENAGLVVPVNLSQLEVAA